jgi:signal transduction histidine kinase
MLSNILEVYEDVGKNKGVHVGCLIDDSLTIVGDQNQIEFIIRNLVNNAIKFTNKGGFVSVTAKSLPYNEVEIAVSDNGLGISDEMTNYFWKEAGRNGTAGEKRTGLGLMLSYEFVKLNGGHIEVESVLGKGTTFKTRFATISLLEFDTMV